MKRLNAPDLFNFGYHSGFLRDVKAGDSAKKVSSIATNWRKGLVELEFRISVRIFDKKITPLIKDLASNGTAALSDKEAKNFVSAAQDVLLTANAEIEDLQIFTFAKRKYSFEKLNEHIEELFRKDTFSKLPDMAQRDFSEAGKCILVDRPTAAAFHSLRAVESVLRAFHDVRCPNPAAANATWGGMEESLRVNAISKLDTAISGQITLIRTRYRNQTQHPKLSYDIDEAQDLLNVCIEVTNHMAEDF